MSGIQRGGAVVARETHYLEVRGSNPLPATNSTDDESKGTKKSSKN